MSLSANEQESLRFHLSFGNIAIGAEPYTDDGFIAIVSQIVSPYLSTGTETTSSTATTADAVTTITVADASAFSANDEAVIDVGDDAEIVVLKATTTGGTETLTARFAKVHTADGYPVATMSGKARLRLLLHDANKAWREVTGDAVGATAGLKSVDKGDVEWFKANAALDGRVRHYFEIQKQISELVRVPVNLGASGARGSVRIEAY